jgi:hypothetical protein
MVLVLSSAFRCQNEYPAAVGAAIAPDVQSVSVSVPLSAM